MTIRNTSTKRPRFLKSISLASRSSRLMVGLVAAFLLFSFLMSSNGIFSRMRASAFSESIGTFSAADCTTPKAAWDLGQTACAVVTGGLNDRRIAWVAPDGTIAQVTDYFSNTASDSYTFATGTDPLAQVGTWRVTIIDTDGVATAESSFVVRDPNDTNADLSLSVFAPSQTSAGSNLAYRLELTNKGPDDAQNVTLTNAVPANTTFVSEVQNSGASFTCTNPTAGSGTGTVSCTITALPSGSTAIFTLIFNVNPGTPNDTEITNVASVSSDTHELHAADNTANSSSTVGTVSTCSVNCPGSITTNADPNQCGAIVSYPAPTTSGDCGPSPQITCNMPSGSFFPVGTTNVTCATASGDACSFTVTVNESTPPTITHCASPRTISADANCQAVMPDLTGEVTATDNCSTVVISQSPVAGTTVALGNTTVTFTAEDSSGNQATCTTTVSVVDTTPPMVVCPADTSAAANGSGQAAVPNVTGSVTASDNCSPSLTITQSPAAGTMVGIGTTTITVTVTDAASNSATCTTHFTVTPPALTAAGPARIWVGLKNSDDVGTKFDLLAEVLKNGAVVGSGQLNDVPGGSSGFNNAILDTINLSLSGPVSISAGDTVSIRLSVRVAASSGHVSGTARLWYDDAAANSRFSATISGVTSDYFLRNAFVLNTAAGSGPKQTIDVLVNRNVGGNPFKPFGTWTKTF